MSGIQGYLQRLMYGRNGSDQYSFFLLVCYFLVNLMARLLDSTLLSYLSLALLLYGTYRMFSKQISKRRAENTKFLSIFRPTLQWIRCKRNQCKDKDHRYFKCPNCSQQLRVPKGKGKISITCRSCGVSFQEKT